MKVLLIGVSTREMAASAAAAGHEVISLDYFADRDQPVGAKAYSLQRDFALDPTLPNLALAARKLADQAEAVACCAGLECEPSLYRLGEGKEWLGNSCAAISNVRDLRRLARELAPLEIQIPQSIFPGDKLPPPDEAGRWLVKSLASSGGMGIRNWDGKAGLEEGEVLQRFIPGLLASSVFLADGCRAQWLGMSRQYSGLAELGAAPFWWCGNVVPLLQPGLEQILQQAADALTRAFGLVGLNCIDFILHDSRPYVIEVNPRPSGSVELYETAFGLNAFELHRNACRGSLPKPDLSWHTGVYHGKGILYARQDLTMPDTSAWPALGIRDVPQTAELIPAGAPICSLLASGPSPQGCWQEILAKAANLRESIEEDMVTP